MFLEILVSILISIRNIIAKEIPSSVETLNVVYLTAIIWDIIGLLVYSLFSSNSISRTINRQLVRYAIIGFLLQVTMHHEFLKSDNIGITSGNLSTNIVFTILLNSSFSSELKENRRQLLGILFIIMGYQISPCLKN